MAHSDVPDLVQHALREARSAIGEYRLHDARRSIDSARSKLAELGTASHERVALALQLDLTESWLTCDESGLAEALAQVRAVMAEAVSVGREDLLALAHVQCGVLLARAGDVEEALTELRPALALADSLLPDDRVRLLLNKGTIASQVGMLDEAADDLRAAAKLAGDMSSYEFMALHNLGYVEYLRGDLPEALRLMVAADELDASVDRSVARLDRARVLMEVGLIDDASALLLAVIPAMRQAGMAEELAEALLDHSRCSLLQGRFDEARRLAEEAVGMAAQRGEERRGLVAACAALEALVAGGKAGAGDLTREAHQIVEAAEAVGLTRVADRAGALGMLATSSPASADEDPASAARLRRLRGSPYLATRLLALQADLRSAPPGRRSRLFRIAALDVGRVRAGMASLDLRTAVAVHVSPIVEAEVAQAVDTGRAAAVLRVTERWREVLAPFPSVIPPADDEVADLWTGLRRLVEETRGRGWGADPELLARMNRLEERIRSHSWAGRSGPISARPHGPSSETGGDTVLSYSWALGRLHVVVLQAGVGAVLHTLGPREKVMELVDRVTSDAMALARAPRGPLGAAVLGSLQEGLERLERLILPDALPAGPVVVVPSGTLAQLPWRMLPGLLGRGVTLSRSLASWQDGRTVLDRVPLVATASGPGLALADDEACRVAAVWSGGAAIEGTPTDVRAALGRADVVHVAAHGRHRVDNPLFSSIALHGGELFAHELEATSIRASLVMLSACGAGRAKLRPGDEALGLTSSLLSLGVSAVVAPMTDVPDALACETMVALHRGLAAGMSGPEALAAASDSLLAHSFTWFGSNWRAAQSD